MAIQPQTENVFIVVLGFFFPICLATRGSSLGENKHEFR